MDFEAAVAYLGSFVNHERTSDWSYPESIKLDRMLGLARELGHPQKTYETVIIAGSKGKGSTAAILASILRMENLRVGLYTSPHLEDVCERIQVNGLKIGPARFVEITLALRRILDTPAWRRNPPTYFELLTAMAFQHFRLSKTHVAVLEVGLGGLYDSTNIAEACAVGLTPISLEHTDKLGKTIAKIAVQKAGVIKGREVVVSAPQPEEAEAVIQKAVAEREAQLWRVGREIKVFVREYGEDSQRFDVKGPFGGFFDLELRLLGRHQIDNACVAIGLAKGIEKKTRLKISEEAVRRGVLDAVWPGRLEKMRQDPLVLLDGAQNADSAAKLVDAVKRHFHYRRLILVLGVSADKDLAGILASLLPEASMLIAARSKNPRAADPGEIRRAAEGFSGEVTEASDCRDALGRALAAAHENDLVLVTGSLFLVGEARTILREDAGGI
ncbi:MAG TPA: folylpolyglutamate synthase/dihydrofolate synthase family protein [Candidatus Eisenbacteria bacterium]|nr:folylpolyglutamate synthase/dihydrofolate synthase family protein [Candidatus Eisenbacteria bacterium]